MILREQVGKHGVVRDKAVHREVIERVMQFAIDNHYEVLNLDFSPVKGPEGNIEYLMHLQKHMDGVYDAPDINIDEIVEKAHEVL